MNDDPFASVSGAGARRVANAKPKWISVVPVPADAPASPSEHFKLGKPSATWTYTDATGAVSGYVLRFEGKPKTFRPLTLWRSTAAGKLEWRWELWPPKRPLYGLRRLAERASAPVVVCEGEKCADAAERLLPAFVAVTSAGGAESAHKADWSPLRGRAVTVWPDADANGAGLKYARQVANLATAAGAASVSIVSPPLGVRDKWDAADAFVAGWTVDRAAALVAAAAPAEEIASNTDSGLDEESDRDSWPDPDMRLVHGDRAPAPSLDDGALPTGWESWITTEAAARTCPRDYVAAGLIGMASAWIGNARRVEASAGWVEPAHIWFALIGAPSTGKTPALQPMIDASRKLEREAEPPWRIALASYERDAEAAQALDKTWRESVRTAANDGSARPDRPASAEEPTCPPRPRVITMDTSTEELQRKLAECPRGLLHVRDELGGWFGGFDRYGGNGADRAFYLECWNGGSYVCDRVRYHDAPVRIEHAALAIIGGMVPDRLREVLTGADDGLLERLLFVWPEPVPIVPLCDRGAEDAAECRAVLHRAARKLHALEMGADEDDQLAPRALRLDDDAFDLFDEQRQEAMRRARAASGLAAGWHGKNPGRILRLALVFELLAWAAGEGVEPASVSADAVMRASRYIDYAAAMLERMIGGLAVGRAEADAAQIARHVLAISQGAPQHASLEPLNERELYQQCGFAWVRDSERRAAAFAVLQKADWVKASQAEGKGRPRGDWEVNPRILEASP
jgi:hypothetical protein